MKRCLIIAGGGFDEKFASSYINQKYNGNSPELFIVADRGLEAAIKLKLHPDIVLGDYDSVDASLIQAVKQRGNITCLEFPPEKDYTDSHLAVDTAISYGASDICILGATGTRIDHVLANIGLLKMCLENGIRGEIVDPNNRIRMINKKLIIRKNEQFGKYVSLIPYSDYVTGITLKGFYYPLTEATFSKNVYHKVQNDMGPSRGISNEISEAVAEIYVKDGNLLVIESWD